MLAAARVIDAASCRGMTHLFNSHDSSKLSRSDDFGSQSTILRGCTATFKECHDLKLLGIAALHCNNGFPGVGLVSSLYLWPSILAPASI